MGFVLHPLEEKIEKMTIRQVKSGWQVDIQPGGRSAKRIRKTSEKKADALAFERYAQGKAQENPEWTPTKKDARQLSEFIDIWHQNHGISLNSGTDTYNRLRAMSKAMGNPRADKITPDIFAAYRSNRLKNGVSANTMNRELAYLRSVFNELIRLGHWKTKNPLEQVRAFKIQERELSYLTEGQIKTLLNSLSEAKNPHVKLIAKICLSTGARWGEAENLHISQVKDGMIQFANTKSGKTRNIPISEHLQEEILLHYEAAQKRWPEEEADRFSDDRIFSPSHSAFRSAIERAKIPLPPGQLTHILRHTFASHFMIQGGNILVLQKILGHHSLTMTMRYAHLSPDHLAVTRELNPLAALNLG